MHYSLKIWFKICQPYEYFSLWVFFQVFRSICLCVEKYISGRQLKNSSLSPLINSFSQLGMSFTETWVINCPVSTSNISSATYMMDFPIQGGCQLKLKWYPVIKHPISTWNLSSAFWNIIFESVVLVHLIIIQIIQSTFSLSGVCYLIWRGGD